MVRYVCKECDYRFEAKSNQKKKKCPYCGKERIIEEPGAEELVKEA